MTTAIVLYDGECQFCNKWICFVKSKLEKNDISFLQRSPKAKKEKDIGTIDSKADALLKWNDLLAKGAITQEEYDKAKRDLLG